MRVFVTGGTGYLGSGLLRLGQRVGLELGATVRTQPPNLVGVAWFPLDIRDSKRVSQAIERFKPDAVIHTAYVKSGPEMWPVIVEGTQCVAQAAQEVGAHLIHLSTDVVFDGETEGEYREDDLPNPVFPYAKAKLEAELRVRSLAPTATIARTSLIWGFDPIDPTTKFALDLALGKQEGSLFYDEFRSFVYLHDLAQALLELSTHKYAGVLHLGGAQALSRMGFGRLVVGHFGLNPDQLPRGSARGFHQPRPRNCVLDSSVAGGLLRTRLRGVEEVLGSLRGFSS